MYKTSTMPVAKIDIRQGRYRLSLAQNDRELDLALRLRFEVFNLELHEGLAESYNYERDRDRYDSQCEHLLVWDEQTGDLIGTYRMQTLHMAEQAHGFYSEQEFDLSAWPKEVRELGVEAGRACIAKGHRNGRVLFLLWRGLAKFVSLHDKRYVFGCSSLTSQDPQDALALYEYLRKHGYMHDQLQVSVKPEYTFEESLWQMKSQKSVEVPKLFQLYLAYSSKVCAKPALDRDFKTIDFLTLLDVRDFKPKVYDLFFK